VRERIALALLVTTSACHTLPPPPDIAPDPEATRIAETWFAQSQGFDVLEAYELRLAAGSIRFAVARHWVDEDLRVLSYVMEPYDGTAFLMLREHGEAAEIFVRLPPSPRDRQNVPTVTRSPLSARPASGDPLSVGAEVAQPWRPDEFVHTMLPDEELSGETCSVIASYLRQPTHLVTHRLAYISKQSGVALRTVYYKGDHELRRVSIAPEDIRDFGGRALPARRVITTADGGHAELLLHNVLADVELPDSLFSPTRLASQRFPKF
jgi:hypothetical protein